jgi:hypothetical protein
VRSEKLRKEPKNNKLFKWPALILWPDFAAFAFLLSMKIQEGLLGKEQPSYFELHRRSSFHIEMRISPVLHLWDGNA